MTIGLATRGYLGGGGAALEPLPCGPGPEIVSSGPVVPIVMGAEIPQGCACGCEPGKCTCGCVYCNDED